MVNRVVSTKLTEEEHSTLLDACNSEGRTPSSFIKAALLEKLRPAAEQPNGLGENVSASTEDDEISSQKTHASAATPESELMKFMRLCRKENSHPGKG